MFRNKYKVFDKEGNNAIKGKQKLFKVNKLFPFVNCEAMDIFEVKVGVILYVGGDYILENKKCGEKIPIFEKNFTFFIDG